MNQMNANNNVFAAAIKMIAEEITSRNGEEQLVILLAFPNNSNSSWLPVA